MMNGRITAIKKAKPGARIERGCGSGYGFIKDQNGIERFFHFNHVRDIAVDDLQEGLDVSFEPYTDPDKEPGKGERARNVTRAAA